MILTIITINLNNRQGLEKTIQSVSCQTFKDFEFIIIDGASTDGSVDVIKNVQNGLISSWISEKDSGIYNAMNKGILRANGEYCFFLNSGDFLADEYVLEKLVKTGLNADIVSGKIRKIRKNGKYREIVPHNDPTLHKLCIHSLPHQGSFIKTYLFNEVGLYNENYKIISDFDFFLRALVIHGKSYQKVNLTISYFNLEGISSNLENSELAKEESLNCLKSNFPIFYKDLMDYRYFYISNLGQVLRLLQKHKLLYKSIDNLCGFLISSKKIIIGK